MDHSTNDENGLFHKKCKWIVPQKQTKKIVPQRQKWKALLMNSASLTNY
jgi:hypothetical protein